MTPKQENKLRELDRWIAEYVMGWKPMENMVPEKGLFWDDTRKQARMILGSAFHKKREAMGLNEHRNKFAPTTDPAAAMAVLEKIAEKHEVAISFWAAANCWSVTGREHIEGVLGQQAETLPLAICRFAKALFAGKDL